MSFRGSFVTEFIYCTRCFETVREVLSSDASGYVGPTCTPIAGRGGIVAGAAKHTAHDCEYLAFEDGDLAQELAKRLCHSVRVVVVPENAEPHVIMLGTED